MASGGVQGLEQGGSTRTGEKGKSGLLRVAPFPQQEPRADFPPACVGTHLTVPTALGSPGLFLALP